MPYPDDLDLARREHVRCWILFQTMVNRRLGPSFFLACQSAIKKGAFCKILFMDSIFLDLLNEVLYFQEDIELILYLIFLVVNQSQFVQYSLT